MTDLDAAARPAAHPALPGPGRPHRRDAGCARSASAASSGATGRSRRSSRQRLDYELGVIISMGYAGYFLIVADFIRVRPRAGHPDDLPRQRAGLDRDLHAGHHAGRPDPLPAAVRALPQPRPGDDARHRRRLRGRPARRGHRLRRAQVRPGPRRPDHHLRHDARPGRDPRRRPRARALATARSTGSPRPSRTSSASSSTRRSRSRPSCASMVDGDPAVKRIIDFARQLEGVARNASTHAAGVVISREPLTELMPLQKATNSDALMTQYEMHAHRGAGPAQVRLPGPVEPDDPAPGGRPRPRRTAAIEIDLDDDPARRRDDVRAAGLGRDDRRLPARVGGHAPLHPRAAPDLGLRPRRDGRALPARARWTTSRPTSGASTARSR